jgi:hypothetical protein
VGIRVKCFIYVGLAQGSELIRGSREFQRFILFVTERFFGTTNDLIMKFVWRTSGSRSSIIQFVYLGTLSEYVEPPEREWLGKWFSRVVSNKAFDKLFLQIFLVAQGCADNYTNPPCLSRLLFHYYILPSFHPSAVISLYCVHLYITMLWYFVFTSVT